MKSSTRRGWLCGASAASLALLATLAPSLAQAQDAWPTRPVKIIVTFPPGGSSDAAARLVAPRLSERLGQQFIIENRPGAGGGIGLEAAAKSAPDGYTFVLASAGGLTANPSLYPKLNYDPMKDLVPVAAFGTSPFVLVASPSFAASSVKDVVRMAKEKPGRLSYASGGNGTAMHLSGELLKSMTGTFITHVPYRGTGPAVLAVMSGDTDLAVADVTSVQQQIKAGKLKSLGIMSANRSGLVPDWPTLAETGLPGFDSAGWFALLAPAGTPAPIVQRLNATLNTVYQDAELRKAFAVAGLEPMGGTPQALTQLMKTETTKWADVIKKAGVKLD